jgi:hypothetical protein
MEDAVPGRRKIKDQLELCTSGSGSEGHLLEPPDQATITLTGGQFSSLEGFAGPERACGDDPSTSKLLEANLCKEGGDLSRSCCQEMKIGIVQVLGFGGVSVQPHHQEVGFCGASVRPSHQAVGYGGVSVRSRHQAVGLGRCPSQGKGEFEGKGSLGWARRGQYSLSVSALE